LPGQEAIPALPTALSGGLDFTRSPEGLAQLITD
jgi:hypothetical protein